MKKITFKLPEGVMIPENKSVGDEFEALATLKLEEDGRCCVTAIDGEPLPGYEDDKDDKRTYAQAAGDAMEKSQPGY
jgi:hypothetical protein